MRQGNTTSKVTRKLNKGHDGQEGQREGMLQGTEMGKVRKEVSLGLALIREEITYQNVTRKVPAW